VSLTLESPVFVAPEPRSAPKQSFYRPELDALRFFAFLGVFFFHALPKDTAAYDSAGRLAPWFGGVVKSGAFGVDLFFALSAYLITNLLLREKETRGVLDVKSFYVRRILRIWPLYFAFVLFALLLTWIGLPSQKLTAPYVAGYALLAGNWMYVVYGLPQAVTIPLWSISIEEQFYLLWPAIVRRSSRQSMIWIAICLLIASCSARVLLGLWMSPNTPGYVMEYNTLVRIDPIALGILLALFLGYRVPSLSAAKRTGLFLLGAATWIVVARYSSFYDVRAPFQALANIVGRPAIALASIAMLTAILGARAVISNPVLVYLGKISYGLYVIHEFGRLVALKLVGENPGPFGSTVVILAALLITVALAAISYRWLESPFLSLKSRFTHIASRSI
jgi:peptidoglycan/LPS O-acetylase OafA/YrhL